MFFFKKKNPANCIEEKPENVAKIGIKTMDTVVTGVILGGISASLYGVSKLRNRDKNAENPVNENDHP